MTASFVLVAAWLVGLLIALYTGTLIPKAPRTSAERALKVYEADIAANKMTPDKWADYITVLTSSGQYGKAQETIDSVMNSMKDNKSLILLEQARLAFAKKDYDGAVQYADKTIEQAKLDLKAQREAEKQRGFNFQTERLPQEETAVLLKAEAYVASGADKKALEAYDLYLKYQPTAANIFVDRGDLRARTGDKAGAVADYKKALEFVPGDPKATAGIKQIGVDAK